jgi:hypothetical protein
MFRQNRSEQVVIYHDIECEPTCNIFRMVGIEDGSRVLPTFLYLKKI